MIDRRTLLAAAAGAAALPGATLAQTVDLPPRLRPQRVAMRTPRAAPSLIVLPRSHFLYFVDRPGAALRYGVGVGRAGLGFTGDAVIGAKREWPSWRPTNEMIARSPEEYARFEGNEYVQPGGPDNPLGARALYLFKDGRDTYYRIHGTNAPSSIGQSVSSGCIRMLNDHVIDLYDRVPVGTPVTVMA